MPIFLIGFMGCGKSTLGYTLSKKMDLQFVDLDIYIENRFHKSIKQLFNDLGEEKFRTIERNMLMEVCDFENTIVACGGGTPCHFDNIDLMNNKGLTVWLDANEDVLFSRLSIPSAKAKRPHTATKTDEELRTFISEALPARRKFYQKAKITFNSSYLESNVQIADSTTALSACIASALR